MSDFCYLCGEIVTLCQCEWSDEFDPTDLYEVLAYFRKRTTELEDLCKFHIEEAKKQDDLLVKRISELEAENKTLHRMLAADPDRANSTGAAQAAMEYQIEIRDKRIKELNDD